jgi:hypothetical protein
MASMRAAAVLFVSLSACAPLVAPPPPPPVAAVAVVRGEAPAVDASHAAADPDDGAEDGEDGGKLIRPCPDGPGRTAARAAFDALSARIDALGDTDDPKPAAAHLEALLATECFRLSAGDPHDTLSFDSAAALRTWWNDGGSEWVEHYLALAEQRVVVVPPSPRKTARALVGAKHPLAGLLCAPGDGACGRETTGWSRRVERAFDLRAGVRAAGAKTPDACEKEALAETDKTARYEALRTCLDWATTRRTALPLGRFRAPTSGWLVVSTSERCRASGFLTREAELRAYDLASGAAYVAKLGCGATTTPRSTVTSGRVPVAVLREAAWMMLVGPLAERGVRATSTRYDVPEGVDIAQPELALRGIGVSCGCGTSADARPWSWMRERSGTWRGQASGVLRPGSSCDESEDHAGELLQIVDDAFEEGCAPASPPPRVAWTEPGEAVGGRPAATFDDPTADPLRAALVTARPGPCVRPTTGPRT